MVAVPNLTNYLMHWLRFRQDGIQEIYFRVPSTTNPPQS